MFGLYSGGTHFDSDGALNISPQDTVVFPHATICFNFQIRPRASVTYVMKVASYDSK